MPEGGNAQLSTVVLAAGEGTRMRSATPKVLHPIAGRPLVEHAVRAAAGLSPDHLVVVVGHGRAGVPEPPGGLTGPVGRKGAPRGQKGAKGPGHAVACGLAE